MNSDILERVAEKDSDKEKIADEVISDSRLLKRMIEGMQAKPARVKYNCAKVIRIISEKEPRLLYPYFGLFADMLDNDNNIMKWEGIYVIGNLACVDSDDKITEIFNKLFAPITGPVMITANNIITAGLKIAIAKPQLSDRIAEEFKKVEKAEYQTKECRNIALGNVIAAFDKLYDQISDYKSLRSFAEKQLGNTRANTKIKAERFCLKYGP